METVSQETTVSESLPESWEWSSVEQLGDVVTGNTPSTKERAYYGGSIPLFKPTDLNAGYRVSDSDTVLTKAGAQKSRLLPAKSVLVTCIGATIGKTGLSQVEGATNQQINALVPSKEHITPEYIYFAFVSHLLQDQILNNASSTTLPILNKSKFSRLKIPLPPFNEQRRIVEKIEELFTKLDAGVRSLKQTQALLKSYRRSVLKAAVEGELSREWREAHRGELEPASELLERILKERRQKFAGKKYKEPASPDTSELPALPEGWEWATVDQLASAQPNSLTDGPFGSNLKTAHYTSSGPRVIRLQNIAPHTFIDEEAHISEEHYERLKKHSVRSGDLVIRALGEPAPVACAIPSWLGKAIVKADCIKFKPAEDHVDSTYVMYALNSYSVQQRTTAIIHGIGRPRLNLTEIKNIAIPLPSTTEQSEIAEEVERRLSVVDKLEATVEASLKQAASLRQSILKRAFSGELVSQDPDDEPARVLLERIQQEHAKNRNPKKGRVKQVEADSVPSLFPESDD